MRIISGKYKGKILRPPGNFKARPTTDFAKEGLFNILDNKLDFSEINVLDLFAGTGSIGLEFASRGIRSVEMIEKNHVHFEYIRKIISDLRLENAMAIKTDVFTFIDHTENSYDIIFADPPYDLEGINKIPDRILSSDILKPGGWFILEHSRKTDFSKHPDCFDQRSYGNVYFSFFLKKD